MTDLKARWQTQTPETPTMSVADIEVRIRRFRTRKACEAAVVLPVSGVSALLFGWFLCTAASNLARVSFAIDLAWVGAMTVAFYWRWLRKGAGQDPGLASVEFHRRQLLGERTVRDTLWLWCFLPLVLAYALLVAAAPDPLSGRMLLADAVVAIGFFSSGLASRATSKRLQRQIDALNLH